MPEKQSTIGINDYLDQIKREAPEHVKHSREVEYFLTHLDGRGTTGDVLSESVSVKIDSRDIDTIMRESLVEYREYYKEKLIKGAARVRDKAISHRDPPFQVGCSLMTKEPGAAPDEYAVEFAHNFTLTPGKRVGQEKRCAERNAIEVALNNDAYLIVAMVTVSKEVSTGDETKAHDALHPCRECRDMLRHLKMRGILRGDSIICNVNDSKKVDGKFPEEEKTVDELLNLYKDDENSTLVV